MAATVDQKLLRATKFPPEFNQKVDMNKVNLEVIKGCVIGPLCCTDALLTAFLEMDHKQNHRHSWDRG